jgi:hypothetical protein
VTGALFATLIATSKMNLERVKNERETYIKLRKRKAVQSPPRVQPSNTHHLSNTGVKTGGSCLNSRCIYIQVYKRPTTLPVRAYASRQGVAASIRLTEGSSDVAKPTSTHTPIARAAYELSMVTSSFEARERTIFMTCTHV